MNQQQRTVLAESLIALEYPIIAKHALTADLCLAKTYLRLAWSRAASKGRYDILGDIHQSKLYAVIA